MNLLFYSSGGSCCRCCSGPCFLLMVDLEEGLFCENMYPLNPGTIPKCREQNYTIYIYICV